MGIVRSNAGVPQSNELSVALCGRDSVVGIREQLQAWKRSGMTLDLSGMPHRFGIECPLGTPDSMWYRIVGNTVCLAGDPRNLSADSQIDDSAVLSALQFGGIAPPHSIWRGVKRPLPGSRTVFESAGQGVDQVDLPLDYQNLQSGLDEHDWNLGRQIELVNDLIDALVGEVLDQTPGTPIIPFSGGVDSGLLAARVRHRGVDDAILVKYSFDDHDFESVRAASMASHLGFDLVEISFRDANYIEDVLGDTYRIFPSPFGDCSTVPTYSLARSLVKRFGGGRPVFDGTGADTVFGSKRKAEIWFRLSRLPRPIRKLGIFYGEAALWQGRSAIERAAGWLRRADRLPFPTCGPALNTLDGILYEVSEDARTVLHDSVARWLALAVPDAQPFRRFCALDATILCRSKSAQKAGSVYETAGMRQVFPFLDPRTVRLGMEQAWRWPGAHEPKHALKASLARSVPAKLVYRPKRGFVGPMSRLFSTSVFLDALDEMLGARSPLAHLLVTHQWRKVRSWLASDRELNLQLQNLVWTAVFLNRWLVGARDAAPTRTRFHLTRNAAAIR